MRSWVLLFWIGVTWPAVGRAQSAPRVGLSWVRAGGAERCIDEEGLRREVRQRLGYDPFIESPETSVPRIEGLVAHREGGWEVALYQRSRGGETVGERTLRSDAPDCSALSEAAALAVALAIDPEAALAPRPPRTAPEVAPSEAPPRPTSGPSPERVRISVGAVGAYDFTPGLGFGVQLGIDGPLAGPLRWMGAATHWGLTRAQHEGADFGLSHSLFSVGMCAGFGEPGLQLDGCVGIDAGVNTTVVYAPVPLAPGPRLSLSATAKARLDVRLFAPLWLGLSAGILVPLVRYRYRVEGREVTFEPSAVAPIVALDLAVRFR